MIKCKKKNPKLKYSIEEVLANFYPDSKDIEVEYMSKGWHAFTYKIKLSNKKLYNNTIFYPGVYVVKILLEPIESDHRLDKEMWKPLSIESINKLKLYSKYGLIPKIHYIDKYVIIMKYIKGKSLKELLENNLPFSEFVKIMKKANDLRLIWKKLGFQHGDIHDGNIILTDNNKLYFIDPSLRSFNKDIDKIQLDELQDGVDEMFY